MFQENADELLQSDTMTEQEENIFIEDNFIENISTPTAIVSDTTTAPYERPAKRKAENRLTKDVLLSVQNHFKRPTQQDDRYDVFGKVVAMKLREFDKKQGLFAEKIINETLFEAEMGNLTMSHKLMTPSLHLDDGRSRSTSISSRSTTSCYSRHTTPYHSPHSEYSYHQVDPPTPSPPLVLSLPISKTQKECVQPNIVYINSQENEPNTITTYFSQFDENS